MIPDKDVPKETQRTWGGIHKTFATYHLRIITHVVFRKFVFMKTKVRKVCS